MPIEIRELEIVAVVNESKSNIQSPSAVANAPDTEKIIAECVEQVLEIIKQKSER